MDTPTETLDQRLQTLDEHKQAWLDATLSHRLRLLESLRDNTDRLSAQWVEAALKAKGIAPGSPIAGEEWTSGPWALMEGVQHLTGTLQALRDGSDPLQGARVRTRANGQVVVRVHPANIWEKLLLSGVEAEVWMDPEVQASELAETMAGFYRDPPSQGRVALVLGAGNIAAIPPLDMLYKLFTEGQVCILKMNPVNDYLGPIFEQIFATFAEEGFVQFAYGGAEVGRYLTEHDRVEEIHITGSERTHDAIIYGTGTEGAARKTADTPQNNRRMTSELGGISPVIVVPGPWTASDLAFQAEHVVTQKMHNGGFNCIASQVMVMPETWDLGARFVEAIRETFATVPARTPYYPGAGERIEAIRKEHPDATILDPKAEIPRLFMAGLDADSDDYCFRTEFFAGALAQTSLPGANAEVFLRNAITFANERLHGTLGATILIHPQTELELGATFEELLAELRYGTIGVNAWSGVNFLLPRSTWGAFPGHARNDIQSGVGVVHNALMFDKPQRTVVRAPWRPFPRGVLSGQMTLLPRPPWFVTNAQAHEVGRRITAFSADPSWLRLPAIFAAALRG